MNEIQNTEAATIPAVTKKQKVLDYIKANPSANANEVAEATGTNRQYVHSVVYLERRKKGVPKTTRGRKTKQKVSPLEFAVKREDSEVRSLRVAVSEHAHIVDGLKKEIDELTVIIAYLEHRCAKAEHHRGLAI